MEASLDQATNVLVSKASLRVFPSWVIFCLCNWQRLSITLQCALRAFCPVFQGLILVKLLLGALIPRSVCLSSKDYKKEIIKLYESSKDFTKHWKRIE